MRIGFYQEGGAMPADQGGAEQDPMTQIIQMAMQAVQSNDQDLALQVCQALVQLVQQSQGEQAGGEEYGGEAAPEEEPVYGKGGKLIGVLRR